MGKNHLPRPRQDYPKKRKEHPTQVTQVIGVWMFSRVLGFNSSKKTRIKIIYKLYKFTRQQKKQQPTIPQWESDLG